MYIINSITINKHTLIYDVIVFNIVFLFKIIVLLFVLISYHH